LKAENSGRSFRNEETKFTEAQMIEAVKQLEAGARLRSLYAGVCQGICLYGLGLDIAVSRGCLDVNAARVDRQLGENRLSESPNLVVYRETCSAQMDQTGV
jgi:hypothetical protein